MSRKLYFYTFVIHKELFYYPNRQPAKLVINDVDSRFRGNDNIEMEMTETAVISEPDEKYVIS